ncbi:MAG: cardiolipin synthase B [Deltaproteobacteria bacterium]|nr:cardiolipin synthase B [Deltaproteobacteria bacterium]
MPALANAALAPPVRVLDGGGEVYPAMLAAIEGARREVRLEVYAFALDAAGERFAAALGAAARRGVQVDLVVDGLGSALDGRSLQTLLEPAGVRVRIFNPLRAVFLGHFRRNHRKLLLVDDEVAYLGGVNVGDEYEGGGEVEPGWADLAVELRGPICAWLGRRLRRQQVRPLAGPVRLWLSGIGGGRPLRRRYLKAIGSARRSVSIAHAYFLPDRRMVRTITAAARRGVAVTLLLPGRSDVPFARSASMRLYRRLLAAGVRIHEWEGSVLHAKAAVVDGERMLIGSFNLDPLSLANLETLLEVHDQAAAGQAERWIARHVASARPVEADAVMNRSLLRRWVLDVAGSWAARAARLTGRLLRR